MLLAFFSAAFEFADPTVPSRARLLAFGYMAVLRVSQDHLKICHSLDVYICEQVNRLVRSLALAWRRVGRWARGVSLVCTNSLCLPVESHAFSRALFGHCLL